MSKRKHVFISHHHADDAHVDRLTGMLSRNGYALRNSSIRAKPANRERIEKGLVSDNAIKRLLRMKMAWASTVIVLIGSNTHSRKWVDWEIETANELGKRIVGVYARGGTAADLPSKFDRYGDALVNWNSDSLIDAIDGTDSPFQAPGGGARDNVHASATSRC
ncbi:hypothetical protein J2X48_005256 [Bosea sp. BE271]|jgi:hypothetical protein|uniref:TIR domain-containing protein n=1 Tax=Bosea TaxID=85413 RepID=UPI00274181C3|nr:MULTISPECIES: TIR domain-containing protein [Bosea]MDR6831574.1 hypothetical protein [Bosea robiniae]MDR6898283.1 hypothetical protein [Bosea sp. BE109]MDR7141674.1 hypothetical protein [Bosea sp. BE168]MDR7178303.1 hypothetical protein [Bosea sp. BE271]